MNKKEKGKIYFILQVKTKQKKKQKKVIFENL